MGRHFSKVGATVILGPLKQKSQGARRLCVDAYVPLCGLAASAWLKATESEISAVL